MFEKIVEQIEKFDSIIIAGHINPDGDCLGSQIGLKETLKLSYPNKQIFAIGSGLKRFEELLGSLDAVEDSLFEESLIVLVDSNDLTRAEDKRVYKGKNFIKLDHHVENHLFTEGEFVVNEKACSCSEIILDLIREQNYKINSKVCNALFLGIMTDTGRYQFVNDFSKIFSDSKYLVDNGANPKPINDILQATNEYVLSFKGYVYTHYKKTDKGVIYLTLNNKELKRFNLSSFKAANMVNLLSNVKGFPIWAFFCEDENHSWKVELRSAEPEILEVAVKYQGGGHKRACGMTIKNMNKTILDDILESLGNINK